MLQLQKVCPATENKFIDQGDSCFLCTGCNKLVMDFRNKSLDEIHSLSDQFECGIFDDHQLSHTPVLNWKKRWTYRFLVAASFLGFTIAPIEASAQLENPESASFTSNTSEVNTSKPRKRVPRKHRATIGKKVGMKGKF